MFQSFSGNSRRTRQVNLSGQNLNPFAASSWSPSATGTQKTVANAQLERLQRQQERERVNASKHIQRTWRGHKARRDLADSRRAIWDDREFNSGQDLAVSCLLEQARLLVTFFSPRRQDDVERIVRLSTDIFNVGFEDFLASQKTHRLLKQLLAIALDALQASLPQLFPAVLRLLVAIIDQHPGDLSPISRKYYSYLSQLCCRKPINLDHDLLLASIRIPLNAPKHLDNYKIALDTYAAFALQFLTTPDTIKGLGTLDDLVTITDVSHLSMAIVHLYSNDQIDQIECEKRLWLLAHFIALYRRQKKNNQEPEFLKALSLQLSASAGDIINRIDAQDLENLHDVSDVEGLDRKLSPLPAFVKEQLLTLVNQESISILLGRFNFNHAHASTSGEDDASLLASYALTLLRIFPRRGDEIRMWLYLGSITTASGATLPALRFFWQITSSTTTYAAITSDSKAALPLLLPVGQKLSGAELRNVSTRDHEWRTILLFLELYTFVLRFTDDEEFLSGSVPDLGQKTVAMSRIRESALPLEDIKNLTLFLKNLAFTTYYNASELFDDGGTLNDAGSQTFTTNAMLKNHESDISLARTPTRSFAGIAGMTFHYVRTIVTGVLRMLYERDSRRKFLPKNHWLMTSRFDMEGFVTAVVMEEERQHELGEGGGEDEDDPQPAGRDEFPLIGMSRPRRAMQIESMRRQQQKVMRLKMLAAIGPKLEVLQNMPFVIPFDTRVKIFREFVYMDQMRRRGGNVDPDIWRMSMMQQSQLSSRHNRAAAHEILGRHHAKIRRDQLFDDAYEQFYGLGDGLKEPIQITFVDQFDTVEAGIDGGGVTKEFLTSITNEAFRAENGPNLFIANDQNLLYPNPAAIDEGKEVLNQAGIRDTDSEWRESIRDILKRYEFLGRVVGKCLYESILVDIGFAGFFLLKWAAAVTDSGYRANINDLRDLDESLYQGLLKLKNYPGNVEDFSLDFTITDTISLPGSPTKTITRELMPSGSEISVTNENRPLYVSYVARHRLQVQPYQQTQAFLRGLGDIIKPSWISMFNQSELQTLIGGESAEIDIDDLRRNTQYGGVYVIGDDFQEHDTVKIFWKVMKELDDVERRKVLKYVTSTPRAPLLGFSQLNPRFSIRDAGNDEERLPSTSTCVNLLKLPRYSSERTLRQKLLYAINSGAGFDLS